MLKSFKNKFSIILALAIIVFGSIIAVNQQKNITQTVFSPGEYQKSVYSFNENAGNVSNLIVLDAGHGGPDGGAVGINNICEKDINLEIALKLRDLLRFFDFDVIMTRESDISIHDADCTTIRQQKVSDMENRLSIINGNPDCIFISIHQNIFAQSKYNGTQVFYSANNMNGQLLAQNIRQSIISGLQPDNDREIKTIGAESYLMKNSTVPSVLIECGFISNQNDVNNLTNEDYQRDYCLAILQGICNYREEISSTFNQ